MSERTPLPLTEEKLLDMAKEITDRIKTAMEMRESKDHIHWKLAEQLWYSWLEKELFGEEEEDI